MNKIQIVGILFSIMFLSLSFLIEDSHQDQKEKLINIAKSYKQFDKSKKPRIVVSDSTKYKWTIALCNYKGEEIMGYHYEKDSIFYSKADSLKSLHGNKLYQLYVEDQEAYYDYKYIQQPLGQIIVKETWNVAEVDSFKSNIVRLQNKNDNKWYTPTKVSQLFIMFKENPSDKNDLGWVYGIVDMEKGMDSVEVLSSGNLSSCISCHKDTKYDRIFGRFDK